ncbi:NACHT domain-containing protein [Kitasatospora acidiphila]|uniref:NACHT domain-containing protein n=1 Tax=Kitasatospora acidiphila TaxID=2567942 RepID=UPI0015F0CB45|nr:NACHT domain-containing protein [Kitasatospora acidiphila]
MQRQWYREADVRGLLDPVPLATRWVADQAAHGDHEQLAGHLEQEHAGDLDSFAEAFRALPKQRLVLLGDAGSGKSSVALLLLLALLERREAGEPVPVLLSLGSWDPHQQLPGTWLAQRLAEDYPALGGAEVAERLLAARLIVPVLDGLDEMSPHRRGMALTRLNESRADGTPLILSCRAAEYDHLVSEDAVLLRGAAVVRAVPVTPQDALEYLRTVVVPQRHAAWEGVFATLEEESPSPLLSVAASPLMLGLLRVFAGGQGDPAVLLRFGGARELEDFLLDALVPTVFAARPDGPRWRAGPAERWLRWLAWDMTDRQSAELAWWQLHRRATDWQRALGAGVIGWLATVTVMVLGGVLSWPPGGLKNWAVIGLFASTAAVLLAQLAWRPVGFAEVVPKLREHYRIQPGSPLSRVPRPVLICVPVLVLALWLGWSSASVISYLRWDRNHHGTEPSLFPVAFLTVAMAFAANEWFERLAPGVPRRNESVDPARALALGRRRAVLPAVVAGLFWVSCTALLLLPMHFDAVGSGAGRWLELAVIALAVGAYFGFYRLVRSLWYAALQARLQLALAGRLPLRLSAFLADAHRLGILRQVGPVYEFRHARLRERLAEADMVSP